MWARGHWADVRSLSEKVATLNILLPSWRLAHQPIKMAEPVRIPPLKNYAVRSYYKNRRQTALHTLSLSLLTSTLVNKLRPVFCVEELAFWLVCTLVCVSSEEVTLSLKKVRRNTLSTVRIVVAE